uniref:hypothetical protein n=1 Tax=Wolbachia endosymbiont (group B) of Athalia cordata TaxID=2953986 RepID=UPI0022325094|nr:hypothetical protein [Wolbachia endosymbiont (group B) of Athalia cordata]
MCKKYDIKTKVLPKKDAAEHSKIDYMSDRNAAIRLIKLYGQDGVKEWKKEAIYGKRSYIEGFFSRLKQVFILETKPKRFFQPIEKTFNKGS